MSRKFSAVFLSAFLFSVPGFSKIYDDVKVGKFNAKFDLTTECLNKTFLACMIDKGSPLIIQEYENMTDSKHFEAVEAGEGVEIILTPDISTYHVKYKKPGVAKAERSGRSYAGVGRKRGNVMAYLADASDKEYLTALDNLAKDKAQLAKFYKAMIKVIANCDVSGFESLELEGQRVLADFVAVYVAEQYRHLTGGNGVKLGRSFQWDDALLQTTLLAAMHAGQNATHRYMYFEGKFTNRVYNQIYEFGKPKTPEYEEWCIYKDWRDPKRKDKRSKKRAIELIDYWQFNKDCSRSGINMTRNDFELMGSDITSYSADHRPDPIGVVIGLLGLDESYNIYADIGKFFIDNDAPKSMKNETQALADAISAFVMQTRSDANDIVDWTRSAEGEE